MAFVNPIGKGLSPERIDMGVDYGGAGPLYALGSGTIVNVYNTGWPGGTFLVIHLDTGQYFYYAEDIQPLVGLGAKVTAGQHIANATGGGSGIEIGWAEPPGSGYALGRTQFSGANSTAYGKLMSDLIASLGGPAGIVQGPISGTVPSSFGITPGKTPTGTQDAGSSVVGGGGGGSWLGFLTDPLSAASDLLKIVEFLINPLSWLRIIAGFAGFFLLLGGLFMMARAV